jgi:hypothetical protein
MKFCQPHWERLKAEIKSHGVADFIAKDGHEAMAQVVGELKGEEKTRRNYDPLMAANMMIWNRAIQCGGLYLMTQKPDGGEYCPICEVDKHAPGVGEAWIKGASKAAVDAIAPLPDPECNTGDPEFITELT